LPKRGSLWGRGWRSGGGKKKGVSRKLGKRESGMNFRGSRREGEKRERRYLIDKRSRFWEKTEGKRNI